MVTKLEISKTTNTQLKKSIQCSIEIALEYAVKVDKSTAPENAAIGSTADICGAMALRSVKLKKKQLPSSTFPQGRKARKGYMDCGLLYSKTRYMHNNQKATDSCKNACHAERAKAPTLPVKVDSIAFYLSTVPLPLGVSMEVRSNTSLINFCVSICHC